MAKSVKRSFYRPHARVQFGNELVDPFTGEISYPPSMTKQEFAAECDINNIMKQYSDTGMIRHVSAKAAEGVYVDLPDQQDFQMSIEIVRQASDAFMSLPAKLRERFNNEPGDFLAFTSDPANIDEMRKLGLANPLPSTEPVDGATAPTGGEGGSPPSEGAKAP